MGLLFAAVITARGKEGGKGKGKGRGKIKIKIKIEIKRGQRQRQGQGQGQGQERDRARDKARDKTKLAAIQANSRPFIKEILPLPSGSMNLLKMPGNLFSLLIHNQTMSVRHIEMDIPL